MTVELSSPKAGMICDGDDMECTRRTEAIDRRWDLFLRACILVCYLLIAVWAVAGLLFILTAILL